MWATVVLWLSPTSVGFGFAYQLTQGSGFACALGYIPPPASAG